MTDHYMDGLKIPTQDEANALNQNFDYCNELAERINLMADAFLALSKRVELLEAQK